MGDDQDAVEFLRKLDEDSSVADFVDIFSGSDLMDLMGPQSADGEDFKPGDLQQVWTPRGDC